MLNIFVLFMALVIFVTPLKADEKPVPHTVITVKGMVCDFCAQSLKKVFGKKEAVESINVNLDTQKIGVYYHDQGRLTDKEIKELITWAGYDLVAIDAMSPSP